MILFKMELLLNFAVKILVIYLFVAIYSYVFCKKLIAVYMPVGMALLCILTGYLVSRTILEHQLPYETRSAFFIFSLLIFYLAMILKYRLMQKKRRERNSNL